MNVKKQSKSTDANVQLRSNKRLRRKWVTWTRMMRYGINSFTRNVWLTTAATVVMTITLLIVFSSIAARSVLSDTVDVLRQRVDIPIHLRADITDKEVKQVSYKLEKSEDVVSVNYVTLEEARNDFIEKYKPSKEQLQTISDLPTMPFAPSLRVVLKDPNQTASLIDLVKNDTEVKNALNQNPRLAPAFTGENKRVIETIGQWASTAEKVGFLAAIVFIAISMLIIFNTIRMAIFNRRDEIEMMKLIGADKNFIRGPFVVEAIMYGFIAAVLSTAIGFFGFISLEPKLLGYGIATQPLHNNLMTLWPIVLIGMIALGAIIGIISAHLAVRRYLKI
ncbi:FtsX-like permease family protein [Candidatus Saccharibacteria bacterium]|nr:FtsX-like permease family protein [Candidatus Saccharibacteria bacterium]NCU40325.1 FtsX-like permease family protein [Candidatus Saccharibacteria bacterium]